MCVKLTLLVNTLVPFLRDKEEGAARARELAAISAEWELVARVMDRLFFVIFLVVFIVTVTSLSISF